MTKKAATQTWPFGPETKLVGSSLCFCIGDILADRVALKQVQRVRCVQERPYDRESFLQTHLQRHVRLGCWSQNPQRAIEIGLELWDKDVLRFCGPRPLPEVWTPLGHLEPSLAPVRGSQKQAACLERARDIRRRILNGTYETPEMIRITTDRLMNALLSSDPEDRLRYERLLGDDLLA